MRQSFRLPIRVYIEDTDAGGIVFYVNYLKFMERARTEWLRSCGYQHYVLAEEDFQFVVHSCNVRYLRSATVDDQLLVSADIVQPGRATLNFHQQVWRNDELLCEAEVKVACVSAATRKPKAMPKSLYESIQRAINEENLNG